MPFDLPTFVSLIIEILLGGALLGALYRVIKGPNAVDRVVALDLMTGIFLCMVIYHAIESSDPVYLNVAVVLALISFVGTVAISRYIETSAGGTK